MEAAAVVTDVGPGVAYLRPGDRVAYASQPVGAYAEVRTMATTLLVPIPDDIDDETIAAVFLKGLAVEFLIHRVHALKEGDTILVHAAAGGMGLLFCQWASALGARGSAPSDRREGRAPLRPAWAAIVYTRGLRCG
jgi:NADPH2:quinone reductase